MSKLDELEKQYELLGKEIEKLKQEDKPWPQVGDRYWVTTEYGHVFSEEWCDTKVDVERLARASCHRTKEQAIAADKWRTSPRTQARRMVEMCEGFDAKGYFLYCHGNSHGVRIKNPIGYDGGLQFATKQHAQAAIDKLGEDLIKVALGVITGEEAERIVRLATGKVQSVNGQEAMSKGG